MRIFIALDISEEIRKRIGEYAQRMRGYAPESRWSKPENLHVTLKFVGHVPDPKLEEIKTALGRIKAQPFPVEFKGAGFFPGGKAPRVFWAGVNGNDALGRLAAAVDAALAEIGIPREEKPYHPHLTLSRAATERSANLAFQQLPGKLTPGETPQFGTMTAQEFFLYQSEPQRGGSLYTKLGRYPLGHTT